VPRSSDSRDHLLSAAEAVLAREGIAGLTLDAVAAEAGVSKGGLTHHYASKDRLVEALVVRMAEMWRSDYAQSIERTPPGPARYTLAMIDHSVSCPEAMNERFRRATGALFAALVQNPALVAPLRAVYNDMMAKVAQDDLPQGVGEAVATMLDGLWLQWLSGMTDLQDGRVARIVASVRQLIDMNLGQSGVRSASARAGDAS
jgi:AcrR family transcriptional regulator